MLAPALLLVASWASPANKTYNETTGVSYLRYASATYCSSQAISGWNCSYCQGDKNASAGYLNEALALQNVTVAANIPKKLLAYVGRQVHDQSTAVVAFRGTVDKDIINWLQDLTLDEVSPYSDLPKVKVHKGFYDSMSTLQPKLTSALDSFGSVENMIVTGHSLGASCAALFAFDQARLKNNTATIHLWTYGQPRTGNKEYAAAFTAVMDSNTRPRLLRGQEYRQHKHWRLTHHKDPVPQYPWPVLGYEHAGPEVFYDEKNDVYKVCETGEDHACQDQFGVNCLDGNDHTSYLNVTPFGSGTCPY